MRRRALFVEAEVHAARRNLPGKVRQRVKQALDALAENPRLAGSKTLTPQIWMFLPGWNCAGCESSDGRSFMR
jgi:hypothetical protein